MIQKYTNSVWYTWMIKYKRIATNKWSRFTVYSRKGIKYMCTKKHAWLNVFHKLRIVKYIHLVICFESFKCIKDIIWLEPRSLKISNIDLIWYISLWVSFSMLYPLQWLEWYCHSICFYCCDFGVHFNIKASIKINYFIWKKISFIFFVSQVNLLFTHLLLCSKKVLVVTEKKLQKN